MFEHLAGWLSPDRMEEGLTIDTGPRGIERRTAMEQYIGLDVSMKETAISIRRTARESGGASVRPTRNCSRR
jgi:hypothetical protein